MRRKKDIKVVNFTVRFLDVLTVGKVLSQSLQFACKPQFPFYSPKEGMNISVCSGTNTATPSAAEERLRFRLPRNINLQTRNISWISSCILCFFPHGDWDLIWGIHHCSMSSHSKISGSISTTN